MAQELRKINDMESLMAYFLKTSDGPLIQMITMTLTISPMILKPRIWA